MTQADDAFAYLVKPIKQADLATAIALAQEKVEHLEALRGDRAQEQVSKHVTT